MSLWSVEIFVAFGGLESKCLYSFILFSSDSPLLWLRADPEMEYLAEIHFNQPVQMWVR